MCRSHPFRRSCRASAIAGRTHGEGNTTSLNENPDEVHAILNTMPDFTKLWERKTSEEIDAILDEQMGSDNNAGKQSRETERYGSTGNSIDKAYDELKDVPF